MKCFPKVLLLLLLLLLLYCFHYFNGGVLLVSIGLAQSHLVRRTCSFLINAILLPECSRDVGSWLHANDAAEARSTGRWCRTLKPHSKHTEILQMVNLCFCKGERTLVHICFDVIHNENPILSWNQADMKLQVT